MALKDLISIYSTMTSNFGLPNNKGWTKHWNGVIDYQCIEKGLTGENTYDSRHQGVLPSLD